MMKVDFGFARQVVSAQTEEQKEHNRKVALAMARGLVEALESGKSDPLVFEGVVEALDDGSGGKKPGAHIVTLCVLVNEPTQALVKEAGVE